MGDVNVCSLDVGLTDLKPRQQRSLVAVLRILQDAKRFSVFEATDNPTIAGTMERIFAERLVERIGGVFPWTVVALTEKGQKLLAQSNKRTKHGNEG